MPDKNIHQQIHFLILAGGRGQRMQGIDKGLMLWQNKPLIEHIIHQLNIPPQKLIISANRNIERYQQYSQNVITDQFDDYQGPLAGILSAIQTTQSRYLLCIPCDSPLPPKNLLAELSACMLAKNKTVVICHDGDRLQPLFSLLNTKIEHQLECFLQQGKRKVHDFMHVIDAATCDFSSQKNNFNNFNSLTDISEYHAD